jgi:hypothetical protein
MSRTPAQDFFAFLLGGGLFAGGIFLFLNQVMVSSFGGGSIGPGRLGGAYRPGLRYGYGGGLDLPLIGGLSGGMGLLMIPLGIGVAMLFMNAYRKLAWLMVLGPSAALVAGVLHSISIRFIPTTLWSLVAMIVMIGAGAGLMFRSLYSGQDGKKY